MTAYGYFGAFFEELASRGVSHAVCSPGSRSAPLVLSAHAEPRLRCWVQLDERAGGYFALGLAKERRECVALICTSGSAAANYLPAVTEAFYDGVPLVVLTADRPPELRDRGAGQTINQIGLYGNHVRWAADLPVPGEVGSDHARFTAHRALAAAVGPPGGPVHLNVPLREPLEPTEGRLEACAPGEDPPPRPPRPAADPAEVAALVGLVADRQRGVLAVGPAYLGEADAAAVKQLGALAGWPLIADAASGLRAGAEEGASIVAAGQHLARTPSFWGDHRPDVLVRAGHPTASRALREGLASWGSEIWLVDPLDRWEEPTTVPAGRWRSSIGALAQGVLASLGSDSGDPECLQPRPDQVPPEGGHNRSDSGWARSWQLAESAAQQTITATLQAAPLLEAGLARLLGETLGPDAILYASNSMPVRDLDAFLAPHEQAPRVVAHRGANGIDGVVSAAAGMAAATSGHAVLLAGDLALLHDLGGLLGAARLGIDLTIVVPNNDGGGIFSFLPVAQAVPRATFEQFFDTPHGTELSTVVAGLGARHHHAADAASLREALATCTADGGIGVIEIPVNTEENVAQHRLVERSVRDAVTRAVRPE
ncbi:MAG: 2-succinyl-5-enolpyruvyl-6-hydroxy-3-cyclohexene-1-carboxylic-acid synthase [bacterium]|nr:2-succinyl-5-enolpyruvyl-6-hydroxy-3-cyclohexene-1-carboxylic-acid synthase [bacterium]